MATIFVAAGGGNSNVGGTYVGGVPPTAADDLVLDSVSGNFTVNTTLACRSLDCNSPAGSGAYTRVFTHSTSIAINIGDGTAGLNNVALRLSSGMTYTRGGSSIASAINYVQAPTSPRQTITTVGKSMGNQSIGTIGNGTWELTDALVSAGNIVHTRGEFYSNNFGITGITLTSSTSNTRVFDLGTSTYTNVITSANTIFSTAIVTGLTANIAGLKIVLSTATTATRSINAGGLTIDEVTYTVANSSGAVALLGTGSTYKKVTVSDGVVAKTLQIGSSIFINDLSVNGVSGALINIASSSAGTQRSIFFRSLSRQTLNYVSITDILITTPYKLYATNSTDGGNNRNVHFSSPPNAPFLRQSVEGTAIAGTNPTATFVSPTAAGTVLILQYRAATNPGVLTLPTGFTAIYDLGTAPRTVVAYKIANGTETTLGVTNVNTVNTNVYLAEIAGFTNTPAVDTSSAASYAANTTATVPSPAISPSSVPSIALALIGGAAGLGGFGTIPTNDFEEDYNVTGGAQGAHRVAYKPLTAIASQDTTLVWVTSRAYVGGMIIFKDVATANGNFFRFF